MFRFFSILIIFLSIELFANVGSVVAINGEASLIREGKNYNLKKEFIILKHDEIKTKKSSKVQLFFNDETIITIGENSSLQVYDYLYDEKNNDSKAEFSMFKGTFKTISGKIGKIAPEKFILKTKGASIGIRGTQIEFDLNEDREIVSCTEGVITITLLSSNKQIILKAGESLLIEMKSKQTKKINNGIVSNAFSFDNIKSLKIDKKYDSWISEKESIRYSLENAFSKGHKVEYNTTELKGTIEEKTDGLSSFDKTNASFDLSIDFGKNRNDNPVEGEIIINTKSATSKTRNLVGNINNSNEIEMTHEVGDVIEDVIGTLKIKNTNLDVEGKNLEFKSFSQKEKILIEEVKFEPK